MSTALVIIPPGPETTCNRYRMSWAGRQDCQGLTVTILPRRKPKRKSSEDDLLVARADHLPRYPVGEVSAGSGDLGGIRR